MTQASKFVGKALYLEFRKGVNTAQIIITPEGMLDNETYVPAGTWRRQISQWSPKKPWKCYSAGTAEWVSKRGSQVKDQKELITGSIEEARTLGMSLTDELSTTLNNLYNNEWKLYEKPIVIDFSQEDLANTKAWETPSALIRRILRARKELGFPDELLDEQPEA
jgi:hypothetical protein